MNRQSEARQQRAAGRRILDDTERLIYFGPGRDSTALTHVVSSILHLEHYDRSQGEPRRVFERTQTGKHFWVEPGFAEAIGIETLKDKRRWTAPVSSETADTEAIAREGLPAGEERDLTTIHDTVDGIIRYVGLRAVFPERIVEQLRQEVFPSTELALVLPQADAPTQELPMGQVIQLRPAAPPQAEIPPARVAL